MVMKRMVAPKFWPIERKTKKYVIEPRPGPHSKYASLPLGVILRDIMKYAFTATEAERILNSGRVLVDGCIRKDRGFCIGIMDVLIVGDEYYRFLPTKRGLHLIRIDKNESGTKLLRIEKKTYVNGGKVQINFHDGRNILLEKNMHKTGDVVVFDILDNKIKDVIKLEKGTRVLIIRGNNIGSLGTVEDIIVTKSSRPNMIVVDIGPRKIDLPKSYVFAVGKNEPVIKLGV